MNRRGLPFLLALVFAIGLLGTPPAAQEVRAALPDLTIVTAARYEVQASQRRVRVTVDMTLTNRLRDTATRRYYFDSAFLAVLPGTSGFAISSSGRNPSVRATRQRDDYTLLRISLGQRLFSGRSAKYRLVFYLRDTGGESTRDVRVGTSLVSFPVWAFASDDTPGSTVAVFFPKGYTVEQESGDMPGPEVLEDGRTVYRSGRLADPLSFFAYFVGDRPGSYDEQTVDATVGDQPVEILVRSWPEDPEWATRIAGLFERSLPALSERIGLEWPRDGGLTVQETVSRSTGGYAGLFDPTSGRVDVAYYADDFVVLHEAAHTWFNGELLVDRWAIEGFASYYALAAATELEIAATGDELTDALREARIQLNAWGPIGREESATEDYAYAASLELARLIAERAGDDGLAAVWQAAASSTGAYQPPRGADGATTGGPAGPARDPELVTGPPDWRGLLDLLEEHSDASYEDLWREWVIRPDDGALLTARAAARTRYEAVVEQAAGWTLPRPIRDAMRAWQFQPATELLDEASAVLDQRAAIDKAAGEAGLSVPPNLRVAFEGDDGFDDARAEIAAQLETIDRYRAATASRPLEPGPFVQLGLWDTTPDADLIAAEAAFAEGDLGASVAAADAAKLTWDSAEQVGQGRALLIAAIVLGVLLALIAFALWVRRWRARRRDAFVLATAGPVVDAAPAVDTPQTVDAAPAVDATQTVDTAPTPATDSSPTQVHPVVTAPDGSATPEPPPPTPDPPPPTATPRADGTS